MIDENNGQEDEVNADCDDAFDERVTLIVCGIANENCSNEKKKNITHISSWGYFRRVHNHDNSNDESCDEGSTSN